jgi:hypothetical protein
MSSAFLLISQLVIHKGGKVVDMPVLGIRIAASRQEITGGG